MVTNFVINIEHELGYRNNKDEQFLAKAILLTSLIIHFYIQHSRGHHKDVATIEDPSTRLKDETVYAFWAHAIINDYF